MSKPKKKFDLRVRDNLCRKLRSKGMIVNYGEPAENDSSQKLLRETDPNMLAWDATTWWCSETSKTTGVDDRPCHKDRCVRGRSCYEAESDPQVA